MLLNSLSSTFCVLHRLVQISHETADVLILIEVAGSGVADLEAAGPEVAFVADCKAAGSGVVDPGVAEPGVVVVAAGPWAAFVADRKAAGAGVVDPEAAGPEVVFVSERQASVDIPAVFVVFDPVSVAEVWVVSPGRPSCLAFPNIDYAANSSSSVEVVFEESVHSSMGDRTNYALCSILSSLGLHQSKMLGHWNNNPSRGYNNVNDTNGLPINATKNHSRNKVLHQFQEQRKHRLFQAALPPQVVRQIQGAAGQY